MTSSSRLSLVVVLATGCMTHEPGTSIAVLMADASQASVTSAFDYRRATLGVANIDFIRCERASIDPIREISNFLSPIRTAHAHQRDYVFRKSARSELMEAGAPERVIEEQSPAAGAYCSIRIGLGASETVPEAAAVEGTLDGVEVRVATQYHIDLEYDLDPPLVLDEATPIANVVLQIQPQRWLDDISPEQIEGGGIDLDRALIKNVHETTSIRRLQKSADEVSTR